MKTRQAIEQTMGEIITKKLKSRQAHQGSPIRRDGPGGLRRPRRRPAVWLLAGALLMASLFALTWDGQWAKAQAPAPPLTVNQPDDAGDGVCDATCTLRDAVLAANATPAADVINFAPALTTITLEGEILINGGGGGALTINGNGAKIFTIDGGPGINRIFFLNVANVTITDVTLTGGEGGGTFYGPVVENTGGVIAGYACTLLLDRVHITNNWAIAGVAGVNIQQGHLRIQNSTFSANFAPSCTGINVGGPDSTLRVVNSTFSSNTSFSEGVGGAVCTGASAIFRNVTIVGNHASRGGGIFQGDGTVGLVNTIVAGNTADVASPEIYLQSGTLTSAGFNLIGDSPGDATSTNLPITYQQTDILDTPPMLFPLDDYGGPMPTHAVMPGSPLIDAGNHNYAFDLDGWPLQTDQRGNGFPRVHDNEVDIGAVEAQATTPTPTPTPNTPTGIGVTVQSPAGDASVTITQVLAAGDTTFTAINPLSFAGATPPGYTIPDAGLAYDITTTANYTPPVVVCFVVSSVNDPAQFADLRILHGEGGQLVNRTILAPDAPAPDFATRTLCARVGSLSPFVVAQLLTPNPTPTPTPEPTPEPTPTPAGDTTAPAVTISTPFDGATFIKGRAVAAGYSCQDEAGGPVKFSLGGNQGLAIFAAGYPASSPIPCDATEPGTVIEETVTAGSSGLSYSAATDQYNFVWKTDRSWRGTCRMLVVRFNDGAERLAKFRFK
ncbi:MAG: PxKF domain-containing protein [Acidobacteria bacterium]|nr:PxKF domain-containing protein [Acidobacteriota bacterium]